jgi:hypothetical protein
MIFGTDWPGVPGPRSNAQAIADLDLNRKTLERIFYRNALHVYERMGAGKLRTIDID